MHAALHIQEILLHIFDHCRPLTSHRKSSPTILSTLARTCRTFKESALDILWQELHDPTPIARCLPDASGLHPVDQWRNKCYYFRRSLTETERSILQSYTRRIQSLRSFVRFADSRKLDWESVKTHLGPVANRLFPNLHHLYAGPISVDMQHLLRLPIPSLTTLCIHFAWNETLPVFRDCVQSFHTSYPNIRQLRIKGCRSGDADAFTHLSHMPALSELSLVLSPSLLDRISSNSSVLSLCFPYLRNLTIHSQSLDLVSGLLVQTQLPAIADFATIIHVRPSGQDLFLFASTLTSRVRRTVQSLRLEESSTTDETLVIADGSWPVLGFEELERYMTLGHLRHLVLDIGWKVDLTSSQLLVLASAWPHLEQLSLNEKWGWKTQSGVTLNGLLQLLQACPSLSKIDLVIDTQGYTKLDRSPESIGLVLPPALCLDVVDSCLEVESVQAIVDFLGSIASRSHLRFFASRGPYLRYTEHAERWYRAHRQLQEDAWMGG